MKNYVKLQEGLFSHWYAYVDHQDYFADQILRQYNVHVKFGNEYGHQDMPYRVIFCKVSKKDALRFEKAMEKMPGNAILLGYKDYATACEEVMRYIGQVKK